MSFQERDLTRTRTRTRSVPPTPVVTRSMGWMIDALRAAGLTPDLGEQTASILCDAGLSVEGAAATGSAGSAASVMPEYMEGCVRSLLPAVLAHGQVTEAEVDVDTVAERVARELKEAGAMCWSPELAAAWARVP
ncbi:hypothetical protein [Streptomyces iranensis]|uniref:Uncharacterized protein n=1 Tax=Streptomyces iranensis TaxID=576784 RepID=A0A060ZL93_9ACTN|nr:hypothetical protein [Streptomyces iranensis]MBP2068673.1 hypothetical protein [Streptomyces iranensis]CDR06870.1 predicted protein [Streptomyces iranensis]